MFTKSLKVVSAAIICSKKEGVLGLTKLCYQSILTSQWFYLKIDVVDKHALFLNKEIIPFKYTILKYIRFFNT